MISLAETTEYLGDNEYAVACLYYDEEAKQSVEQQYYTKNSFEIIASNQPKYEEIKTDETLKETLNRIKEFADTNKNENVTLELRPAYFRMMAEINQ